MAVLAGSGFKEYAKGTKALADSGQSFEQLLKMPQAPLFLAGAGIRDVGNSMNALMPLIQAFMPPKQPEPEASPQQMNAAMTMLGARLGEGISGIQLGPQMGGAPMGAPSMGY